MTMEIAQPFHIAPTGGVAFTESVDNQVRGHLRNIILTGFGERVMLPEFGSPVREYLFETADPSAIASLTDKIREACTKWETRAQIVRVEFIDHPEEQSLVDVRVSYRLVGIDDPKEIIVTLGGGVE